MKQFAENLLNEIGVTINGNKPYDIQIHDDRIWGRIARDQSVGAGEAYMDGWWDCDRLDELYYRICRHKLEFKFQSKLKATLKTIRNSLINQQSRAKAAEVSQRHYNVGNRLFELMLGPSMAYTCGYWKDATNLDDAEFAKYELVCKKLDLKPGEEVLELGCGWGGLAKYMAEKHGCKVVACDVGVGPAAYAKEHCKGLPVEIYECDYRDVDVYNPKKKQFDKIVSVGVLEHVGYKNYSTLLDIASNFMKDDGIFLLHSIGSNITVNFCDPWINNYIFPNGHLPSLKQLGKTFENRFVMEDLQNFGAYYDKTLLGWHENLNKHWPELKGESKQFDERFLRMMNYYLLTCAGGFRARSMQLWQFVLTKEGRLNGYRSIR